jgi:ubiquitin C-terminal hydrolase
MLRKFVYLTSYFNPTLKANGSLQSKTQVDAESIFIDFICNYNPEFAHQDCQEYLAIMLDLLHDELKLIRDVKDEVKSDSSVGDWNMVSEKAKGTMNFNN